MTGTLATALNAAFSPSPPRGMIRSTTPSWVASSASSSRPPPATSAPAPPGTPTPPAASLALAPPPAERAPPLPQLEPVAQPPALDDLADRILQRRDLPHAVGHRGHAP